MKINKSKQELARIIRENGGWRDGARFAWFQGKLKGRPCHEVWFGEECSDPEYAPTSGSLHSHWSMVVDKLPAAKFDNWHQTILSREEYLHLYPATDAKTEFCESVMRSIPEPSDNPTIEQLAADYRAKLEIAKQAQEEADSHRCGAEAAFSKLEIAVKELGFKIEPINAKQETELVITDWRDLRVGDVIWWCGDEDNAPGEYEVKKLESDDYDGFLTIAAGNYWVHYEEDDWKFIRRP